jgi:hypothetical protein
MDKTGTPGALFLAGEIEVEMSPEDLRIYGLTGVHSLGERVGSAV